MDVIPYEIIANILLWLPIKSVLQCRCVCKTWCSIISNAQFTNMLLHRGTQNNPNIIVLPRSRKGRNELYYVEDDEDELQEFIIGATRFDVPFISQSTFEVIGSCNGLSCLLSSTNDQNRIIYIFIPATGDHMKLPELTIPTHGFAKCLFGFGFSVSTQELKVVQVLFYTDKFSSSHCLKSIVQVYTLGSSSWRRVGNAPVALAAEQVCSSTFINGSLHWITPHSEPPDGPVSIFSKMGIVSFDLSVEEFGVVPKPESHMVVNHLQKCFSDSYQLGVLGGCLSVADFSSNHTIDVWVMKSYNVKESWIKQFTIPQNSPAWFSYMLLSFGMQNLELFKLGFRNSWILMLHG